jgi:hypothetical protein
MSEVMPILFVVGIENSGPDERTLSVVGRPDKDVPFYYNKAIAMTRVKLLRMEYSNVGLFQYHQDTNSYTRVY